MSWKERVAKDSDEHELRQAIAAKLTEEDWTQQAIADKYGVAVSTVSRLLSNNPFLSQVVKFDTHELKVRGPAFRRRYDRHFGLEKLRAFLTRISPHSSEIRIEVVQSSSGDSQKVFSKAASPALAKWLGRADSVGVCWGRTLSKLIPHTTDLLRLHGDEQRKNKTQFVPLCGIVSPNLSSAYYSATNNALRFHVGVNKVRDDYSPTDEVYNANFLPIRYPLGFAPGEPNHDALKSYFSASFSDYLSVFHGKNCLARELDTIVTSIAGTTNSDHLHLGSDESFVWPGDQSSGKQITSKARRLKWRGKNLSKAALVDEIIDGDIGGIVFPKANLAAAERAKAVGIIAALNFRLTTITPDILMQCAAKSGSDHKNGVIVVAVGVEKAIPIVQAVRQGYVSRLVVDRGLADALAELSRSAN